MKPRAVNNVSNNKTVLAIPRISLGRPKYMYPYSNEPPRDEPYPPTSYPPVPPYQYQNYPAYQRPEPPPSGYPIMRVIGVVGLIVFLTALLGFHYFFFWPIIFFWPLFFAGG